MLNTLACTHPLPPLLNCPPPCPSRCIHHRPLTPTHTPARAQNSTLTPPLHTLCNVLQEGLRALFAAEGFTCEYVLTHRPVVENRKKGEAMHRRYLQAVFTYVGISSRASGAQQQGLQQGSASEEDGGREAEGSSPTREAAAGEGCCYCTLQDGVEVLLGPVTFTLRGAVGLRHRAGSGVELPASASRACSAKAVHAVCPRLVVAGGSRARPQVPLPLHCLPLAACLQVPRPHLRSSAWLGCCSPALCSCGSGPCWSWEAPGNSPPGSPRSRRCAGAGALRMLPGCRLWLFSRESGVAALALPFMGMSLA